MSNTYNADSIESLGLLGGVRAKPASIGLESHSHTVLEILMNAIDEARAGFGNKIIITKHKDKTISIEDFGRSLPMAKNSKGEYAYKKVFEEMWAGGKYKNNSKDSEGNYKWSCGTNGMGVFGCTATADFLEATAYAPNNKQYYVKYEKGVQVGKFQETTHNKESTGTVIHWIPSKEVFKGDNNITKEFIEKTLNQQRITNDGISFIFNNEEEEETKTFYYENGSIDYIKDITKDDPCFSNVIRWTTVGEGRENTDDEEYAIKANITFAFNNVIKLAEYYHNSSYLENGGTPQDFIKNGFTYAINKYIEDNNLGNKNTKVTFEDIADSLIIITDTYSTISLYTDQAKKKIESKFMKTHVSNFIKESLALYFEENQKMAKKICEQIIVNSKARVSAENARKNVQKKLSKIITQNNNKVKIENLTDCNMKKSKLEERTLLVVEGRSAKSTVVEAFDNRIDGALGLRGRFISCLKKNISDVLNNDPAYTLIQALGCGIEIPYEERKGFTDIKTFDESKLRYSRVGILTDADCFGSAIRIELLTFFYKYMPTLLKEGRIYIVVTPRYEIKMKNGEYIYLYNEREKDDLFATLDMNEVENIGIKKGLGEFNKEVFWEDVLSPKAKEHTFIQVSYDEAEEVVKQLFEDYMGNDTKPRKQFVQDFIANVDLNEIN